VAGNRSALIVATHEYDDSRLARLRSPVRDAEGLAEVLADPGIGAFDVTTVLNKPWHEVQRSVAMFFRNQRPDDLALVHFSCHGLKDDTGELYFAATDTSIDLLEATAVSSRSVNKVMDQSRAGRVLLLLDCCYSGAFARGMVARAGPVVDVNERLGGRGRAVITAATALQFAFEGGEAEGNPDDVEPSLFTTALVEGLRTGEADRDLDGWISLDELYNYIHEEVTRVNPNQTPTKWAFDIAGDIRVARRGQPVTQPSDLPPPLTESMASLFAWERAAVIEPLLDLLHGTHPGRALGARLALEEMAAHDDSDKVKSRAREALASDVVPFTEQTLALPVSAWEAPSVSGAPMDDDVGGEPAEQVIDESPGTPELETVHEDQPEHQPGPTVRSTGYTSRRRPWLVAGPSLRQVSRRNLVIGTLALALVLAAGAWVLARILSAGSPSPLPDHTIVFGQDRDGSRQLVALDTRANGVLTPIANTDGARGPAVSPDRTRIAYFLTGVGAIPGVPYLIGVDGSDRRRLLSEAAAEQCPRTLRPAWSRDGRSLALTCFDNNGTTQLGVWVVDVEGTQIRELNLSASVRTAPTWGDGRIYFVKEGPGGDPNQVYSAAAAGGGDQKRETEGDDFEASPDWSESGLIYVASGKPKGRGEISLSRGDGIAQLETSARASFPTWSPDGKSVAWLETDADKVHHIWIAKFITDDAGNPSLENARELDFSGVPSPPGW